MQPVHAQETHQGSSESHSESTTTTVPAAQSNEHGSESQTATGTSEHGTMEQNTASSSHENADSTTGTANEHGTMKTESHGADAHGTETHGSTEHGTAGHAGHDEAAGHGGTHEQTGYHAPEPYVINVGGATVHLNTLLATWLVMAILIVMAITATRRLAKKPDAKQVFFESLVDLPHYVVKSQIAHHTIRYVPLIGTIFLFILVSNWMGLLPWRLLELMGTPHGFEMASPTNDLNTNGAIAITAVAAYWFFGIKKKGLSHFKHYFQPMWFLFPLNMMEDVSRPLSLSFRLFGNILGGEIVIGILLFLTSSYVVTSLVVLPMFTLEVLVGFIQAFIFSMLTASYIGGMVAEHH